MTHPHFQIARGVERPMVRPAYIWDRDEMLWTHCRFHEDADGNRIFTPVKYDPPQPGPKGYSVAYRLSLTIRDIEAAICTRFHLDPERMRGPSRCKIVARPRQIAFFLARELTGSSLPKIGRYFNRDHTTALAGIRRIQALIASNPKVAAHIDECRSALAARAVDRFASDRVWAERLKQGLVSWNALQPPAS